MHFLDFISEVRILLTYILLLNIIANDYSCHIVDQALPLVPAKVSVRSDKYLSKAIIVYNLSSSTFFY